MNICIVDDEQNCIDDLKSLLNRYASEHDTDITFSEFTDGPSFIREYKPDKYHIVFLDIYIDEITGMELARNIREQSENNIIIFCTTSISDMPEAFRYHAFEYIVKPPEYPRISRIMDDAINILPKLETYIDLPSGAASGAIALSSICSVTTSGHYLDITIIGGETFTERLSLGGFLDILNNDNRFLVINKGILVNMDHIKVIKDKNCMMDNGEIFPVKVREASSIKKHWQEYNIRKIRKGQGKN